ncbi:MAG: hypothetical protein ACMVY4_15800 [Minwuia sp.]|uniref:hypothetical protein n=1 Tax=Minwuia sp. TaxID=2493630 RepID=UPI003A89E263
MYYLLVAAAVSVTAPTADHGLITIEDNVKPAQGLSAYDLQRINYNVRNWEAELGSEATVHFGTFDDLEACKAARADLRIAMREAGTYEQMRSNCYESKEQVASN